MKEHIGDASPAEFDGVVRVVDRKYERHSALAVITVSTWIGEDVHARAADLYG